MGVGVPPCVRWVHTVLLGDWKAGKATSPDPGLSVLSEETGREAPLSPRAHSGSAVGPGGLHVSALPPLDLPLDPEAPQTEETVLKVGPALQSPARLLAAQRSLAS